MADLTGVIRFIGTVIVLLSSGVVGYYPGGIEEAIEQIEAVPPDIDASSYLLPAKLSHKYMPYAPPQPQSSDGIWKHVPNPNLYVLTERDTDSSDDKSDTKSKRSGRNGLGGLSGNGPSLSIVNPLEVLRQRLLLEIARRRMRQSEDQIQANRELLKTIGKRSFGSSSSSSSSRLSPGGPSDDSLPLSISSRSHSSADSNSNSLSHRFDQEAEMDSGADHRSKRSVPVYSF